MIYFATCGRGFEHFVKEELLKLKIVNQVLHLNEGKLIFSVCTCCTTNCTYCERLKNTFANLPNVLYQVYSDQIATNFVVSEFKELLTLKLVEKVYKLLLYKPLKQNDLNISDSLILNMIEQINFSLCKNIFKQYKENRDDNQIEWIGCMNTSICPASQLRQEEKQKSFKREKKYFKNKLGEQCKRRDHFNDKLAIQSDLSKVLMENKPKDTLGEVHDKKEENFTYRLSCRIRGIWKNKIKTNILSNKINKYLSEGQIGDLSSSYPDLDIYLNLNDNHLIIGASLSRKPLSLRPYIPHITLRSTICHLMLILAMVKEGDVILDQMCGTSSILVEAVMNWKNVRIIGGDIEPIKLISSKCNLRDVAHAEYIRANAERLPLLESSIDVVVCDFPFGRKHSLNEGFQRPLLNVIKESTRVINSQRRIVLLVSPEQKEFLDEKCSQEELWNVELWSSHLISLGLTTAYIYVLRKTSTNRG